MRLLFACGCLFGYNKDNNNDPESYRMLSESLFELTGIGTKR